MTDLNPVYPPAWEVVVAIVSAACGAGFSLHFCIPLVEAFFSAAFESEEG